MKTWSIYFTIIFTTLFLPIIACQTLTDEIVGKKPEDIKTINITMIAKSASNPVFLSAKIGAEDAAKELSEKYSGLEVKIDWRTPRREDAQEQAERILNAVQDGSNAILVSCSDEKILSLAIDKAVDSGVPVMTFDSDAPNSKRFAFYGPNDLELGEHIMTELITFMGDQGQIAILGGNPEAPNLQQRVEGIQNAAAKYPGIKIVGVFYHSETAEDAAAEVLRVNKTYPELRGWAMVGGWPFFNDTLLNKLEPGKIKIVAVDALPVELPYIEKGIVQVLFGQPTFRWGKVSVEKIIDKIYLDKDVPVINEMKLIPVSKANLGGWSRQLRAWGYDGIPVRYLKM